MVTRFISGEER